MPWGSADACWERVSSIFGHPSVPGEGRFNVFPCVFCLTWTAAAWPTGVHTRWPQEEGICPTFLSCWVRSQLSGCVQIAVLLPSALQVGAGGSRSRIWTQQRSSWLGGPPLGKGGVHQVSECILQQPRGCLFWKGPCRKLKQPKVTMTPWYRKAPLLGETEGVSISLFYKSKGQFINLQQEVELQGIVYLGPQQKKVMTEAPRPGIRLA